MVLLLLAIAASRTSSEAIRQSVLGMVRVQLNFQIVFFVYIASSTHALAVADIQLFSMLVNLFHCSFSAEGHCARYPCSAAQQR
jgi:hypothetical protein